MDIKDVIFQLVSAEAYLSDDIQALAYIQEDLETTKKDLDLILKIPEITNTLQILLRAMFLNKKEMEETIKKYYEEVKKNGNTSVDNSEKVAVENQQA